MKHLSLVFLSLLIIVFTSCEKVVGDGPVRTETRNTGTFTGIETRLSGEVYYKHDNVTKVEVTAQQNVLDVIETYVSNGKLIVKYKNGVRIRSNEGVVVTISSPNAQSFEVNGSGNITTQNAFNPTSLWLEIKGSGNINVHNVTTNTLTAHISGSGNINVDAGTTDHEEVRISGSGGVDLADVVAKNASTRTSGSGSIKLNVTDRLEASISGSGSVYYRGNPLISSSISGSGRVAPL
jgi:hypothetical protein